MLCPQAVSRRQNSETAVYDSSLATDTERSSYLVATDGYLEIKYFDEVAGTEKVIGDIPYGELAANIAEGGYHLYKIV